MKLYIAGPISNTTDWRERFAAAEEALRAAGYDVVSPVANACATCGGDGTVLVARFAYDMHITCPDCPPWAEYLRLGLLAMLQCRGVALLPGWRESTGAQIEADVAIKCALDCAPVDAWVAKAKVAAD